MGELARVVRSARRRDCVSDSCQLRIARISASWYIGVPGSNADRGGFDGGAPHRPRLAESANESATDEQGGNHSEG